MAKSRSRDRGPGRFALTAATADRHVLYEASVQSVEFEADFLNRLYRRKRGRPFHVLREDFCGTAKLACEWAKRDPSNRAIGVDLHGPTLSWGMRHHVKRLGEAASRVILIQENVLEVTEPRADVAVAFNYSYGVFKEREILRSYFRTVRKSLRPGGIFVLDSFGGTGATEEGEEERKIAPFFDEDDRLVPSFTYIWEQKHFNPVTFGLQCRIHFRFADRTEIRNAFRYDWRYWTLPEMRELLIEAGFAEVETYFEGWDDKKDEADGIFRKRNDVEEMAGWVGYVVALK